MSKKFATSQLAREATQDAFIEQGKAPAVVAMESAKPKAERRQREKVANFREAFLGTKKETKSFRLNSLITPSLYERVKAGADSFGISVNEYVNLALKMVVEKQESECK